MLSRLHITQYALIEEAEVEFGRGLNVLTGETGAGKSILVDSMALLLGARASSDSIREGAEVAVVEGLFMDQDEERLVRREVQRDRTNRCNVDGRIVTARMLREEGERWVDLHGQHDDRLLMRPSVQRELLDAYAGAVDLAEAVARAAGELAELDRERRVLREERAHGEDELAYLRAQVAEIDAAKIREGEEEELEAEAARLRHSGERSRLASEVFEALEGDDHSVASVLASLERQIARLAELDPDLAGTPERLAGARYELADVGGELGRYSQAIDLDPVRLSQVEARKDLLAHLRRKHGPTLTDVIDRRRDMAEQIRTLTSREAREAALDERRHLVARDLRDVAGTLADAREAAADRLEAAVADRLADLGMGDGSLLVQLSRRLDPAGIDWGGARYGWTRGGLEEVAFLIKPNVGEAARRLAEIASGGELSRTLLALKAALAEADRTPTLIFDEIDAGIGGVIAHHVARQLVAVAAHRQVIVVTHLAQIAAAAGRHLVVEKSVRGGRTVTTVREVQGEKRVREVSRLLGGDPDRNVSLDHARALLAGGV